MPVICWDFGGNLPFTGNLQEVSGLLYPTSTRFCDVALKSKFTLLCDVAKTFRIGPKEDARIGLEKDVFSPKGPHDAHSYGNVFRVLGVDNHLITQMGFPCSL